MVEMTNEEALKINKNNLSYWKLVAKHNPESKKFKDNIEALQMAINALKREEQEEQNETI